MTLGVTLLTNKPGQGILTGLVVSYSLVLRRARLRSLPRGAPRRAGTCATTFLGVFVFCDTDLCQSLGVRAEVLDLAYPLCIV